MKDPIKDPMKIEFIIISDGDTFPNDAREAGGTGAIAHRVARSIWHEHRGKDFWEDGVTLTVGVYVDGLLLRNYEMAVDVEPSFHIKELK